MKTIIFDQDIPKYADLMPLIDFENAVEDGLFTDNDGVAKYSNGIKESKTYLDWYDLHMNNIPSEVTHIAWYNK